MNVFKQYFEYINDNPQRYWFKRKLYGWGWTPATWQGWAVFIAFIIMITLNTTHFVSRASSDASVRLFGQTALLILVLLKICYEKGEPPKWQWGVPKKK